MNPWTAASDAYITHVEPERAWKSLIPELSRQQCTTGTVSKQNINHHLLLTVDLNITGVVFLTQNWFRAPGCVCFCKCQPSPSCSSWSYFSFIKYESQKMHRCKNKMPGPFLFFWFFPEGPSSCTELQITVCLSSPTKTPAASSWDNSSAHLPNQAINFDDWRRKAWNKDLQGVVWGIKVMGAPLFRFLSDIFLNNNPGHGVTWTGCCLLTEQSIQVTHFLFYFFFLRCSTWPAAAGSCVVASAQGMIGGSLHGRVYLLSRSRRPSQLLGGDLCRTEFMLHLFGTIWACNPLLEKTPRPHRHSLLCSPLSSRSGSRASIGNHDKRSVCSAPILSGILRLSPFLSPAPPLSKKQCAQAVGSARSFALSVGRSVWRA